MSTTVSHGSIVIEGDQVLYRGQLMHGLLSQRLVEALEAGGTAMTLAGYIRLADFDRVDVWKHLE